MSASNSSHSHSHGGGGGGGGSHYAFQSLLDGVQWSLENSLFTNAVFLAERLNAAHPSDDSVRTLANCFHRQGRVQRAYNLLKTSPFQPSHQTRYLHALCCYELGKFGEAEMIMDVNAFTDAEPTTTIDEVPNGAAGYYLLGMICKKSNQKERASTYFKKCLELNPMMWSAYEALCLMGVSYDPVEAFTPKTKSINVIPSTPQMTAETISFLKAPTAIRDLSINNTPSAKQHPQTPTISGGPEEVPIGGQRNPGLAALLNQPLASPVSPMLASSPSIPFHAPMVSAAPVPARRRNEDTKRKGRLFPPDDSKTKAKTRLSFAASTTAEAKKKAQPVLAEAISLPIHQLLILLGKAFQQLCQYKCKEAILAFQQLPLNQYNTGWVLCQVGKAYFEMVDYAEAQAAFQQARRVDATRVEGMEIYSTILWHLRRDAELSYLAHELVKIDKKAPESWCVVGNCFSLQKEHETALKFFQRAIQLDPGFAYAYTLSGHEYISNDDLEKALKYYRYALDIDSRHYNAWYGLGMIYYRQEKYDLAEYHFQKALSINNISSVLYCYYGMISHAHRNPVQALDALNTAIALDPNNTLAKYKKASVLVTLERYDEALEELQNLKDSAPKEAPIFFLMGRIYRKLGHVEKAMQHYTMALDLDPKNANYIKSVIEKIHANDVDDDDNNELT